MVLTLPGIGQFSPRDARDRLSWQRLEHFLATEPKAFDRDPWTGHVTGSAFVLSPDHSRVLLTHHAKLDRWLQLGGHCDGVADAGFVALKEAYEESGLSRISMLSDQVFDIDIHEIPARGDEPAHLHFDVRFLMVAQAGEIAVSNESHALDWFEVERLQEVTSAESVLVLTRKLPGFP